MKKIIISLLGLAMLLSGCSSGVKADKVLVCMLREGSEESDQFFGYMEVEYDSESDKVAKSNYSYSYERLEKNEYNNAILIDLINRKSKVEDLEGVTATLDVLDYSFGYAEAWDYNKVDLPTILELDLEQPTMGDEEGYYASKIKKLYEGKGYSCDMNGVKQKEKQDTTKK